MRELLKITAQELRRILKIAIFLPESYYTNMDNYKAIISFDGELFFNYLNEETKKIDIDNLLKDKRIIFIAISSPSNKDWRISELNPYYCGKNPNVDSKLAYNFSWYINYNLIPDLKEKYRISDDLYVLGMNEGANLALYLASHKEYSGVGLINYNFSETDERINENIEAIIFKKIYASGEKNNLIEELKNTDNDIYADKFINFEDSIDKCIDFFCEE